MQMNPTLKSAIFVAASLAVGLCFQLIFRFEPIRFYSFWIALTIGTLLRDPLKNWLKAMIYKNSPPSN